MATVTYNFNDNIIPGEFTLGGDANWSATLGYIKSGSISHDQESWISIEAPFDGSLAFRWKVSSEEDYDYLQCYKGATLTQEISGVTAWANSSPVAVQEGDVIKWRYVKDYSVSEGDDCGFVDDIVFTEDEAGFNVKYILNPSTKKVITYELDGTNPWPIQPYNYRKQFFRTSNNVLWAVLQELHEEPSDKAGVELWYSTDEGKTWTQDQIFYPEIWGHTPSAVEASLWRAFMCSDDELFLYYNYAGFSDGVGDSCRRNLDDGSFFLFFQGTPNAGKTSYTFGNGIAVNPEVNLLPGNASDIEDSRFAGAVDTYEWQEIDPTGRGLFGYTTTSYEGTYAGRMIADSMTANLGVQTMSYIPIIASETYTFSVYARMLATPNTNTYIYIRWYDSDFAYISEEEQMDTWTTTYTRYSVSGTAPANAVFAKVKVWTNYMPAAGSRTWIMDAFQFERAASPTTFTYSKISVMSTGEDFIVYPDSGDYTIHVAGQASGEARDSTYKGYFFSSKISITGGVGYLEKTTIIHTGDGYTPGYYLWGDMTAGATYLDFEHNGDGKTKVGNSLYCAFIYGKRSNDVTYIDFSSSSNSGSSFITKTSIYSLTEDPNILDSTDSCAYYNGDNYVIMWRNYGENFAGLYKSQPFEIREVNSSGSVVKSITSPTPENFPIVRYAYDGDDNFVQTTGVYNDGFLILTFTMTIVDNGNKYYIYYCGSEGWGAEDHETYTSLIYYAWNVRWISYDRNSNSWGTWSNPINDNDETCYDHTMKIDYSTNKIEGMYWCWDAAIGGGDSLVELSKITSLKTHNKYGKI